MTPRDIDRDEAPFKYAAAMDAQRRNTNGRSHFSDKQIAKALGMMYSLQNCYSGRFFKEPNWRPGRAPSHRNKFAAIKIENPSLKNPKGLKFLTDGWAQDPSIVVDPIRTPQGITYRVYFT